MQSHHAMLMLDVDSNKPTGVEEMNFCFHQFSFLNVLTGQQQKACSAMQNLSLNCCVCQKKPI